MDRADEILHELFGETLVGDQHETAEAILLRRACERIAALEEVTTHYDPALRELDGRDPRVAAYVEADPAFADFFARLTGMLGPLLPRYAQEGKSYLTIAVGCTGGRHRSVAVAEKLAAWLAAQGLHAERVHRDLGAAAGEPAERAGPP